MHVAAKAAQDGSEAASITATSEQAIKTARKGGGAFLIGVHKPGSSISVDVLGDLLLNQVTDGIDQHQA
jgi:S-(hydroxymethyl)glutathione dehydrogenase/alcohol dehydrogenase